MTKNNTRRIFSLMLSVMLVFCSTPFCVTAGAYTVTETADISAAAADEESTDTDSSFVQADEETDAEQQITYSAVLTGDLVKSATAVSAENTGTAAEEPSTDESGVYQIATAANLYWFAQTVNNTNPYISGVLTADIDLNPGYTFKYDAGTGLTVTDSDGSEVTDTSELNEWTPIGTTYYMGTFDGQGHTVSGLYINDSTADDQGLFGIV